MSQQQTKEPQQQPDDTPAFDPGHVTTRQHYERLARQAAAERQK
ncbi:hypothetical protein [Pseudoduganella rivuli]|nr:hypothetical protein [Pseudoduganella rivuli]